MIDLKKQYKIAKAQAIKFMKLGNINAYFKALENMNHYKSLMYSMVNN